MALSTSHLLSDHNGASSVAVITSYSIHYTKLYDLLEVMIALAIVSVALVSLLSLGNRSVAVQSRLQRLTQATLLAQ